MGVLEYPGDQASTQEPRFHREKRGQTPDSSRGAYSTSAFHGVWPLPSSLGSSSFAPLLYQSNLPAQASLCLRKTKASAIHSLSWASPLLPALFLNTSPQGCFVLIRLNVTSSWRPLLTPDLRVEIVLGYSSFYPPIHYYIFFVALSTSPYCTAVGLFFVNSPASSAHLPDPCS